MIAASKERYKYPTLSYILSKPNFHGPPTPPAKPRHTALRKHDALAKYSVQHQLLDIPYTESLAASLVVSTLLNSHSHLSQAPFSDHGLESPFRSRISPYRARRASAAQKQCAWRPERFSGRVCRCAAATRRPASLDGASRASATQGAAMASRFRAAFVRPANLDVSPGAEFHAAITERGKQLAARCRPCCRSGPELRSLLE
jgi:hypothetical protein